MTEREGFDYQENRIRLDGERGCKCEGMWESRCTSATLQRSQNTESKSYLKQYGKEVIHPPLNLATVCSLKCNDAVLLDPKTHPIEAKKNDRENQGGVEWKRLR